MIYFKKLTDEAILPKRATDGSAGFDLHYSGLPCVIKPGERAMMETSIAMSLSPGLVAVIKPRSGLAVKYGIDTLAGIVDSDYRGELKVVLINHGKDEVRFTTGDRIAQLVVTAYVGQSVESEHLSETQRGTGGFGSTG